MMIVIVNRVDGSQGLIDADSCEVWELVVVGKGFPAAPARFDQGLIARKTATTTLAKSAPLAHEIVSQGFGDKLHTPKKKIYVLN